MILPMKVFAAMPEISAGEKYFNPLNGNYILKENVFVSFDNHGFKAKFTADEARGNMFSQKCWATGNVNFSHNEILFRCEKAFLHWQANTVNVSGSIQFDSKGVVAITADSATFNWQNKIADFYGKVKVIPKSNLKLANNLKLDGGNYSHVQFDVRENKILQLDKTFGKSGVTIPASDVTD